MSSDLERARALALLEAAHRFPVEYEVSVIALSVEVVFTEVRAAIECHWQGPWPEDAYQVVPSKTGRYNSHRFRVPCGTPDDVLALLARLRAIKGVMTVL